MHNLLESRRIAKGQESPMKLENLSPEKYGKAAYVELTYTPSKLADNLLYKQVTTMKKMEEGNGKLREFEAFNALFQDRLEQIKEERDGIQSSLTAQIQMYKKLLKECETKNQARIKQIQASFKSQMAIIIAEKEEEAKYAQSEKEILENRIQQLENIVNSLKDQLDHHGGKFEDLVNEKQKLDIKYENVCEKLSKTEQKMKRDSEEAKQKYEDLSRKLHSSQVEWKKNLEDSMNKKEKQIENIERFHRTELEKIQNKRATQNLMKNQEIKDLTNAFQSQGKRLNQILSMKERLIENVSKDLNREKQKVLDLTRSYQKQINNLAHEKSRLLEEVDDLNRDNADLSLKLRDSTNLFENEKINLEGYIRQLKGELERNQINYIREKDRSCFMAGDLEKQIFSLRTENANLISLASQNEILSREVKNLRDLLMESSHEMERCKEEFMKMGRERDILILKIRELGGENQVLYRIKQEREDQARTWKENYYHSRHH